MTNQELIHTFYNSFANNNAEGMIECYHNDIQFQDPAFGKLEGNRAKNMWRMLLKRSKGDLKIEFTNVKAEAESGSADWIARYKYGSKKRPVVNYVHAEFEFKDGKIIKHTDSFNIWKWSRQALGFSGTLLGWTGFMQRKIQSKTNQLLSDFISGSSN